MTNDRTAEGLACWADLWTSDVASARHFYGELLGWEAAEPDPQFGGYFLFMLDGAPVAGAMGDMGDMKADNTWKPYLATDSIDRTLVSVTAHGGTVLSPAMPVGDLGSQAVFDDPTGAHLGAWQANEFDGFPGSGRRGLVSWVELHTDDHDRAVAFYSDVFGWKTESVADTDEFRYTTVIDPRTGEMGLGVYDASADAAGSHWLLYFQVDDVDVSAGLVPSLGGTVIESPNDTPYGRMSLISDPTGATFRLMVPPA